MAIRLTVAELRQFNGFFFKMAAIRLQDNKTTVRSISIEILSSVVYFFLPRKFMLAR